MNKLGVKAFSLVETLVAAAVIGLAIFSVIAVVRKGQEQMWVNLHRRTARAILDTTLEGQQFYPGNYGSIPATIASDSVVLDATTGKPKAQRSFSITSGTVDVVAYKSITVKLRWQEYAGAAADSVVIERRVPDIPDSLQNIAPFADTISSSTGFYTGVCPFCPGGDANTYALSPSNAIDGITGLCCQGEWVSDGGSGNTPWIRLAWKNPHHIKKIALYDRAWGGCRATNGTVYFNGGATAFTTIAIPGCPSGPPCSPGIAIFGPQSVQSIRIQLSGSGCGANYYGLSEVQVFE